MKIICTHINGTADVVGGEKEIVEYLTKHLSVKQGRWEVLISNNKVYCSPHHATSLADLAKPVGPLEFTFNYR